MEPRKLWDHQVNAIRVGEVARDLGLFFEQGTGKTRTMIEILRRKYATTGVLRRTLILCPVIVCDNWKQEFKMYSKIKQSAITILEGSAKNRAAMMKAVGMEPRVIITNFEAMQMTEVVSLIELWGPEILIVDESQRLKNPQSMRAKVVARLADVTAHNYILSGTPILDGKGMDAYMQFRILDRGQTFGKNFFAFRNRYFYDKNAGMNKHAHFPKWESQPGTILELHDKIKTKAIRVLKKDCLDLPPMLRQVVHAQMSVPQLKAYKEMYNDFIAFIESKRDEPRAVVAQLAVTKSLRLQQIVSGFAKDDQGDVHRFDTPRLAVLKELLESIAVDGGHKVIVWAVFKENYKMIAEVCDQLGLEYRTLTGDTPSDERKKNMNDFRTDPKVQVMIANQGAGGVGINLVEASYAIYYSKGFKLEDDLQSEARNYRGGSEVHDKVTRIDIVTPGTIDELVTNALHSKQAVGEQILGWREAMKI